MSCSFSGPRWSRADAVSDALGRAILQGRLRPGEPLHQKALAAEFGVSQITVRDALDKLVANGLATRQPYRGVRVIDLSAAELAEAYSCRGPGRMGL